MLSAAELHRRGTEASQRAQVALARRYFERAAERTRDPDLLAQIEISTAYLDGEAGNTEAGFDLCRRALRRRGIRPQTKAVALSQRGLLRLRTGDFRGAQRDLDASLAGLEDEVSRARAHLNRGNVHLQLRRLDRAREDFREAESHYDAWAEGAAMAGHNLAYVELLAGNVAAALAGMERHRETLAGLGPVARSVNLQDHAEALLAAGLPAEADEALAEVARIFGARGLGQSQGEAEVLRARTLLQNDPTAARTVARRAARRFGERGSDSWQVRAETVALMAEVARGGRSAGLVERADALAERLRTHGLGSDIRLVQLQAARVLVRRGRLGEAALRLSSLQSVEPEPVTTRLLAHEVRADLARAAGDDEGSFAQVRAGLGTLHGWQSRFGSMDLQTSLVGHGRALAVDGLRMALRDGSPERVYEWSERARTLVSRVAPVRPPDDPKLAAELAELRLLRFLAPAAGTPDADRIAVLETRIREHAWYGAGSGEITEPAELADLTDALGRDAAALVAWVVLDGRVTALVVTAQGSAVRSLGASRPVLELLDETHADLDMAASDLPDALEKVVLSGLEDRLARLGALLVEPLADLVGDRRLVVTPSNALARCPWTLLPGLRGRPLTVPQSATRWLTQPRPATPLAGTRAGFVVGPGVERAEEEVTRAAAAWPRSTLLRGPQATVGATAGLVEYADLLHLAAHGRHSLENPQFSEVLLADGSWYGYDIDRVVAMPHTVVLSACELGATTARAGEESVGMTAAWLHAGVGTVIAAPTLLGDAAACATFAGVHRHLADGAPPADALAAALSCSEIPGVAPVLCYGAGW